MGTRNLTMVISGSKTKVAQYGQWDGYPSGQGITILEFLLKNDHKKFVKKLDLIRFATPEDEKKLNEFMDSIGSKDGWMNSDQAALYHKEYPLLSRDNGAGVLDMIMKNKKKTFLTDSSSFKDDGMFCEWWYEVNFDENTFKVFGSSKKCLKKYNLNKLPTETQFLIDLKDKD